MTKAVGYVRASTFEQADSGLGLEAQRARIKAYCELKGLELTQIYEDPGVSTEKPLAKRKGGAQFLEAVQRERPVIVVAKLDRPFRSLDDFASNIVAWDKLGCGLVCIAEGLDTTDANPFARAMIQIIAVFAELERALIKQRTRDALGVKRQRGEQVSRHAPYGWDFVKDGFVEKDGERKALHKLIENASEQPVLLWIREQDGKLSPRAIARSLNERAVKTKCGGLWRHSTIVGILKRNMAA